MKLLVLSDTGDAARLADHIKDSKIFIRKPERSVHMAEQIESWRPYLKSADTILIDGRDQMFYAAEKFLDKGLIGSVHQMNRIRLVWDFWRLRLPTLNGTSLPWTGKMLMIVSHDTAEFVEVGGGRSRQLRRAVTQIGNPLVAYLHSQKFIGCLTIGYKLRFGKAHIVGLTTEMGYDILLDRLVNANRDVEQALLEMIGGSGV